MKLATAHRMLHLLCISLLIDLRCGSHHLSNCLGNLTGRQETVGMLLLQSTSAIFMYVNFTFMRGNESNTCFCLDTQVIVNSVTYKSSFSPRGINKATTKRPPTKNTRFPSCYAEMEKDDSAHCEWIFGQKGDSTSEYVHTTTPQLAQSLARILKAGKDAIGKKERVRRAH